MILYVGCNQISLNMMKEQPKSLSPHSSNNDPNESPTIIQTSKFSHHDRHTMSNNSSPPKLNQQFMEEIDLLNNQNQLDEMELEMLVEECQELICKLSNNIHNYGLEQPTVISEFDQSIILKKQLTRLEKQYMQLCLEIQRQQKQLQNFRFRVQVAQKQAQYYTRQIKEKTTILQNLEQYSNNERRARQSFRK